MNNNPLQYLATCGEHHICQLSDNGCDVDTVAVCATKEDAEQILVMSGKFERLHQAIKDAAQAATDRYDAYVAAGGQFPEYLEGIVSAYEYLDTIADVIEKEG